MAEISKRKKKKRNHQYDEVDLSDHDFLFPNEIGAYVPEFFQNLVSGRLFKPSFSILYQKSQQVGWLKLLVDERQKCKTDRKQKSKRLILNRYINEFNENSQQFNNCLDEIQREIDYLMSIDNDVERANVERLKTIENVFEEVLHWRNLQTQRRLFCLRRGSLTSLILLQNRLTDYFLELHHSFHHGVDVSSELHRLFQHTLIFVEHPASSDCIGASKYEKSPTEYMTKIKTRMIFLLDAERIRPYLKFSDAKVVLYPFHRSTDPHGDAQTILQWKERTIQTSENHSTTFLYIEMTENELIYLKKFNEKEKSMYNTELYQLTFVIDLQIIGTDFTRVLTIESQPFGLCCRANYFSRYLAKIFLEQIQRNFVQVSIEHYNVLLEEKICQFYRRLVGVHPHRQTRELFREKLNEFLRNFLQNASDSNKTTMSLSVHLYEELLSNLFNQMKFLHTYPILGLLYSERIFVGLADDQIDQLLCGTAEQPELLLRFQSVDSHQSTDYPNILLVIQNGVIRRAKFNSNDVMEEIVRCVCEAGENRTNSLLIFSGEERIPYSILAKYYDEQLNQIEEDSTDFYSVKLLFKDINRWQRPALSTPSSQTTMASSSSTSGIRHDDRSRYFVITGVLRGGQTTVGEAFQSIQMDFSHWCQKQNCQGSLGLVAFPESHDESDTLTASVPHLNEKE